MATSDSSAVEGIPSASGKPSRQRWMSLLVVLTFLVGAAGTFFVLYVTGTFSTEIRAEPIRIPGENPFTPPMGQDQPNVITPPNAGQTFSGDTSGLYGGTLNSSSCDKDAMATFLQSNPAKAAAWAGVLDITPADIPAYVAGLTPLILRSDTAVTNHGFSDGKATVVRSVLQAGTAVLVDKFGLPRVRCYCGNPLTPPQTFSRQHYVGLTWPAFSPANITIIRPATQVINEFSIVNPITNAVIYRPVDRGGERGRDLRDASIAGIYSLTRTTIRCDGYFGPPPCNILTGPMNIRIDCSGIQCSVSWIDGGWSTAHPLIREGNTYRYSGEENSTSYCNNSPRPATIIFEVTVTSAETINGVWRARSLQGRYLVSAPAVPGCDAGFAEDALSS